MPPGTKKRVSTAEDYDSDGGFVANDEDGDDRPKAKKSKTGKSSAPAKLAGSKDIREGKGIVGGGSVGANGEEFWEVSRLLLGRVSWPAICFVGGRGGVKNERAGANTLRHSFQIRDGSPSPNTEARR